MKWNVSTGNSCRMFECSYFDKETHIVITTLYIVATLINFCGNSLVWKAVIKNKKLWSPMNYMLLNLSLSDIVGGIVAYPYLFILDNGKIFEDQRDQTGLCIVTEGLGIFFTASGVSLTTLCGICYNRIAAVKFPLKKSLRMGRRSTVVFNILTWVTCTAIMVPSMLAFRYESKFKSCVRDWGKINALVYRLFLVVAGTALPIVFLLMSYLVILFYARNRPQVRYAVKSRGSLKLKKAERMVGLLILTYLVCFLPVTVYWILASSSNYFPSTVSGVMKANRWLRIAVFFCTLNGAINPIVYIFGSSEIDRAIRDIFNGSFRSTRSKKVNENVNEAYCKDDNA